MCLCVTIKLSLYQVHPGTDLMVKRLDVFQQVQLTLSHSGRTRFRCVCLSVCVFIKVCAVFLFEAGVCVCVCVCHSVSTMVCGGVSHWVVVVFWFYFLQKHTITFHLSEVLLMCLLIQQHVTITTLIIISGG